MTGIYISTILSDTTNVTPLFQCYLLFKKHRRQQTDVNMLGKHKYITRYDYNLTIMKSPKPATDTIYPHMKFWWYRTMLNFYPPFLCRVFGSHFENGRHLENFENAELLLKWWPITMSNFMSLSLSSYKLSTLMYKISSFP
jgi:hypothetical protein